MRETWEETGLRGHASGVLGSRNHPLTGRWIIYVAAAPAGESAVGIDGTEELAEVRWVGWRKPIS